MKKIRQKKGQFQFVWIFAIIVGALVLFLAFYFIGTTLLRQRYEQETVQAQFLDILMNPFVHLGDIAKITYIPLELPKKSEIQLECSSLGNIGSNSITLIEKGQSGIPRVIYDKYIFARQSIEGKKFEALSKPFEMPWRVADVIILWPSNQKYCFVNAPLRVENELSNTSLTGLAIKSIFFSDTKSACPAEFNNSVCFDKSGCEIKVTGASNKHGSVIKQRRTIYFVEDALMYAAIFSNNEIYNCNLKRLASRLKIQTMIYEEKAIALSQRNCNVNYNLQPLKKATQDIIDTNKIEKAHLLSLKNTANSLEQLNRGSMCQLF